MKDLTVTMPPGSSTIPTSVVIVEDDPASADVLQRRLQANGMNVSVGRTGGDCENTGTAPHNDSLCTASFMLAGGQIITQGLSDTAALFGGKVIPWAAITGGTGIYRNAHGSSTVAVPVDVPNQTDADFVLYLR